MEFYRKDIDIIIVKSPTRLLSFRVYDFDITLDEGSFLVASPIDNLDLYPSGDESVIVFRVDKVDGSITGFEDDVDVVNKVMENAQRKI